MDNVDNSLCQNDPECKEDTPANEMCPYCVDDYYPKPEPDDEVGAHCVEDRYYHPSE